MVGTQDAVKWLTCENQVFYNVDAMLSGVIIPHQSPV